MSAPEMQAQQGSGAAARTGLALSIQQPWAWLIVNGYKDVENRTWATNQRGWIGIHAGKAYDHDGDRWVRENFPEIPLPEPCNIERGGIVGRARLANCTDESDSPWFFGPYGFVMSHPEPLPFVPCRGALGFFRPAPTPTPEEP
jgi:hypothetical protein